MAKTSMIEREKKRKLLNLKYDLKRQIIKKSLKTFLSLDELFLIQKKFQKLPRNSSPTRIRNRCWKTGRPRAVYSFFGLSRHVLREMAHQGLLAGVIKASW